MKMAKGVVRKGKEDSFLEYFQGRVAFSGSVLKENHYDPLMLEVSVENSSENSGIEKSKLIKVFLKKSPRRVIDAGEFVRIYFNYFSYHRVGKNDISYQAKAFEVYEEEDLVTSVFIPVMVKHRCAEEKYKFVD